jgi:hypothetical protein
MRDAEAAYADALALRKRLADDFPARPEFRQDLADGLGNLGVLLQITGRLKEAEAAHTDALTLRKQLAADFPDQSDLRNGLADSYTNLALLRLGQRDFKASKAHLDEAGLHHEAALRANPRHPEYRQCYRNNLKALIQVDAGLGDWAGAKQAAQKSCDLGWDPPRDAYAAARGLSLCIPIVRSDDSATKDERDQRAACYGDEAMQMLRAAAAKGYKDDARMGKDDDLAPLRERDDFKKLLAELKASK